MISDTIGLIARQSRKIMVVGDVMLDEYKNGVSLRQSPESGCPVVSNLSWAVAPGGAANVAANIVALSGCVELIGVIGNDAAAIQLRGVLVKRDIYPGGLFTDPKRPTTTKTRISINGKPTCRLDTEVDTPIDCDLEDSLLEAVARRLPGCSACVLSDYAKGVVTPKVAQGVIRMANDAGIPIVADPKGADAGKYRGATVVKPNMREMGVLSEGDSARPIKPLFPGSRLLVTMDGSGMILHYAHDTQEYIHIAAVPVPDGTYPDTSGAGDTVAAGLAIALAAGVSVEQAARFANLAAGLVVRKPGTATVTLGEMREFSS